MARSTGDKELEKIYNELKSANSSNRRISSGSGTDGDLVSFFVGLVMLGAGLFMIFNNISVSSNWGGYMFHIGSFHLPNGMIMFPLILGIGMLFFMERKIFGWVVVALGILIVLFSVLLTTHLEWRRTSAYIFIIMFGMTAAGAGMVVKELFRKR